MVRLFDHSVRRRGLRLHGPCDCFAYSVFEIAWMYRVGWGLTLFPLGKPQAPWFCHVLPRISHAHVYSPQVDFPQHGTRGPVFIYTGYSPLLFHSWKSSSPLPISVINCEADNMYTTRIKPFLPTFQQLVNPSLVVFISLFPSREMYHLSPNIKGECPAVPWPLLIFP